MQTVVDVAPTGNVYLLLMTGEIRFIPKAGGTVTPFTTINAPLTAVAIAADDTNVWLLVDGDPNDATTPDQSLLVPAIRR